MPNCRTVRNAWNDRLDGASRPGLDLSTVEAHLVECSGCREYVEGMRLIEQLLAIAPPESPRPLFHAQLLELAESAVREKRGSINGGTRLAMQLSGVAAGLVAALLLTRGVLMPPPDPVPVDESVVAAELSARLPEVLELASAAGIEFVQEASSPAARLGAVVFGSEQPAGPELPSAVHVPLPDSGGMIESVGRRVGGGMKPLAGSARKAFDFLLGPVEPEAEPTHPGRGA
ncbi:MAG: hypothetical protein SFX72_01930 [Isosphaeraceae bacterium]|nr:hypothetical protein [Isosphaeraceae bacterium]